MESKIHVYPIDDVLDHNTESDCCGCKPRIEDGVVIHHAYDQREVIEQLEAEKNNAYQERDKLVCALSKMFNSYLAKHPETDDWDDEWRWIVYIELPTGQVSWHIHESEKDLFSHLSVKENNWDGHSTEEKYRRLSLLKPSGE